MKLPLAIQWPLQSSVWPPATPQKSRMLATLATLATRARIPTHMPRRITFVDENRLMPWVRVNYYIQMVTMARVAKAGKTAALAVASPGVALATVATHPPKSVSTTSQSPFYRPF
jgi:hypothetical protein